MPDSSSGSTRSSPGELPVEHVLHQLPQRVRVAKRFLAIEYRTVHDGARITSVVMILRATGPRRSRCARRRRDRGAWVIRHHPGHERRETLDGVA